MIGIRSGRGGEVRCGYQVAARLGAWDKTARGVVGQHQPDGPFTVVAEVVERNAFWLDHGGPFDLVLHAGDLRLRWRNVTVLNDPKLGIYGDGPAEAI